MRFLDILGVALSTFRNNRMRTLLTVLGISIGSGSVVFLVSLGYGLQQITLGEIQSGAALTTYTVTAGESSIIALDNQTLDKIRQLEHVDIVSAGVSVSGQVLLGKSTTDALITLAPSEYVGLESPLLEAGKPYDSRDADGILITSALSKAFSLEPSQAIGQQVQAIMDLPKSPANPDGDYERTYTVRGVIKDALTKYVFLPPETLPLPSNIQYTSAKVKVDEPENMIAVKTALTDSGLRATSLGEKIEQINRIFRIGQIVLLVIGAIALLVASIGTFNTLTISLLERTRDIGILKALGATDKETYAVFLMESTLLSTVGGLVGIGISMGLGFIINFSVSALSLRAGGESLPVVQAPTAFLVAVIAFSVCMGLGTGLYPARRAAKINPLDALRYE